MSVKVVATLQDVARKVIMGELVSPLILNPSKKFRGVKSFKRYLFRVKVSNF
jgi:hypothetical protein